MATLMPGHYLATEEIACSQPFASNIRRAEFFDIIEGQNNDGKVLVRREGIRVWKDARSLAGKAVCVHRKVVSDDGFHMELPVGGNVIDGQFRRMES